MRNAPLVALAALAALLAPARADAWGARVHRYLTRRAVDLLPAEIKPLFDRNRDEFVLRSNDPDLWRLVFPEEAPNHQIDFGVGEYGPPPFVALPRALDAAVEKFGMATLQRRGMLPWRVEEVFGLLRRAMEGFARRQAYAEGNTILYAAALAHYVEDLHQPLHVHDNYDGQLTDQLGIHSRFETELFERFEARLSVAPPPIVPVANARDVAFEAAIDAHRFVPQMLQADKDAIGAKDAYDDEYFEAFFIKVKPIAERQLSRSIAAVASLITAAWERAGKPEMKGGWRRPVQKVQRVTK
jgi:hypothetical protein